MGSRFIAATIHDGDCGCGNNPMTSGAEDCGARGDTKADGGGAGGGDAVVPAVDAAADHDSKNRRSAVS
jgi:hypothetical protein